MNEKRNSNGFWAGLVIGVLVGVVAQFAKKEFDLTPHFDMEVVDDRVEKVKTAAATTVNNLKKRFFKKSGKKLSFFW